MRIFTKTYLRTGVQQCRNRALGGWECDLGSELETNCKVASHEEPEKDPLEALALFVASGDKPLKFFSQSITKCS